MDFGTSYYPELIPQEEWTQDLDKMRFHGLTVVRIAEFAWSRFEPRENEFDFGWLDHFLELLNERRIQAIMCTPTAAPPAWFIRQFPEACCVLRDQERPAAYGTRRIACVNSSIFRHFSTAIARRLGQRYGQHPAVVAWQIDNELIGPENHRQFLCHCPDCQWRFRDWLKQRYLNIKDINDAWGLGFWSLDFSDFGEVITPRRQRNTLGHELAAYRFYSDSNVEFIRLQHHALRQHIADNQVISHNSTGIFDRGIDHRAYARAQDETGWDAYLGAASAGHPMKEPFTALGHDMFRSALHKPFWVFETNPNDEQDAASLAEMHARGAKKIIFWHWRSHRAGMEQGGNILCDTAGRPNQGIMRLIADVQERLPPDEWPSQLKPCEAAIVFNPDNVRAEHLKQLRPLPSLDGLIKAYQPFWQHGVPLDMVDLENNLSGYRLLIMPAMALLSLEDAERIREYVRQGGVLLVAAPTAHKDQHGVFFRLPAEPLLDVLGISELSKDKSSDISVIVEQNHQELAAEQMLELAQPSTACILAKIKDGRFAGQAAALHHSLGKGQVFYTNVRSLQVNEWLGEQAALAAGLQWLDNPHADVSLLPDLQNPDKVWCFNHSNHPRCVLGKEIPPREFIVHSES